MSSLQDKLYNHEVTPPVNTWEKIAAALDETQFQKEFSSRLYNMEVAPPAIALKQIFAALDETQLQDEFPSRLYNMEIDPPANVWEKVAAGLNEERGSVSAPVRRLTPFLRYAAAAVFIGAVAYGIIKLTVNTNTKENSTVLATPPKDSSIADKNKPHDSGNTQMPGNITNENGAAAIEEPRNILVKLDRPVKKMARAIASSAGTIKANSNDDVDPNLSRSIYAYADYIPKLADRYVMLMTPDGNIIRMSKKWSDLLCCVSGEEQDADCKDQLKKWQEKIATSSLAPSPGNFMDILGLVNSLNDSNGL